MAIQLDEIQQNEQQMVSVINDSARPITLPYGGGKQSMFTFQKGKNSVPEEVWKQVKKHPKFNSYYGAFLKEWKSLLQPDGDKDFVDGEDEAAVDEFYNLNTHAALELIENTTDLKLLGDFKQLESFKNRRRPIIQAIEAKMKTLDPAHGRDLG